MAIQVAAAPPGYLRAYASTSVQVARQGVLHPAAFAQWRPFVPGTDEQYTGPLFADPFAIAPLLFPARADARGLIQVWAPDPVRIEVGAWLDGYPSVRQVIDLLFTEDTQALVDLSAHVNDPSPHLMSASAGNVAEWRSDGLYVPQGAVPPEYVTETELGAALVPYITEAETDARYATIAAVAALEARVAALESQMVSHIHAAGDWDYLGGASVPDGTP